MNVWIVSHCEVYLQPGTRGVDEMFSFVASSKAAALRFIHATRADPGTWWRLEEARVDEYDVRGCARELRSREGRLLKRAPVERGYRAAIARYTKELARMLDRLKEFRREGRPRRDIDLLGRALRSTRRCLKGHS